MGEGISCGISWIACVAVESVCTHSKEGGLQGSNSSPEVSSITLARKIGSYCATDMSMTHYKEYTIQKNFNINATFVVK